MSEVSFYILDSEDNKHLLYLTCNLIGKAYSQNKDVFVLLHDNESATALDDLLWEFPPYRFVPHRRIGDEEQAAASIILGDVLPDPFTQAFLINAKNIVVPENLQVERIFDIVLAPQKDQARQRYFYYRKLKYKLNHYEITHKQLRTLTAESA